MGPHRGSGNGPSSLGDIDIRRIAESALGVILTADSHGTGENRIVQFPNLSLAGLRWSPDGRAPAVLAVGKFLVRYTTLLVSVKTGEWKEF
jgi:hypothetical protein